MVHAQEPLLDALLRALADPTRRRIYRALARQPGMSTGQLVAMFPGMTRWGVMKHLGVLREAGLVQSFHDGRHRRHYADDGPLSPLRDWLSGRDDEQRS